jgi:hypothetical protein
MSSAMPSHRSPSSFGLYRAVTTVVARVVAAVRAVAFWTATLLPLVAVGGIAAGVASQYPTALAGILTLNAVCAVVGHGHRASDR